MNQQINDFIYTAVDLHQKPRNLFVMALAINFCPAIGIFMGFVSGGILKTFGIVLLFIAIFFMLCVYFISFKKINIYTLVKATAVIHLNQLVSHFLFTIMCFINLFGINWGVCFLPIPIVLFALVVFEMVKRNITLAKYSSPKKLSSHQIVISFLGFIIGIFLARKYLDNVEQNTIWIIVTLTMLLLSCVGAGGVVVNFLKLYYLKLLSSVPEFAQIHSANYYEKRDKICSRLKHDHKKKMNLFSKMLIITASIFVSVFFILFLIGVFVSY